MTIYLLRSVKVRILLLLGILAIFTCGFGPPTLIDREIAPTYRMSVGELRQMETVRRPTAEVTAGAVLVYDMGARQTLISQKATQPLPPASLTKLMTALLIFEEGDLGASVTILPEDQIGGATMGLTAGETLTVEQLLWGLLVPSGNDAAMALARHHSGQVHVFVQRMNLRATELGLEATHFENPHGLDADGHVSSAADLLDLTLALWEYPLFREMVGTASVTVAGHDLRSTNQLLDSEPGAIGVKTGTTDAAGECLIAAVELDGHPVLAVVLGSSDRYADVRILYGQYARNYEWRTAALPARLTALDRLFDDQGNRWFLSATGETSTFFLPRWEEARLRAFRKLDPLPLAPWRSGAVVGTLEWYLGDVLVGTQPLVLR